MKRFVRIVFLYFSFLFVVLICINLLYVSRNYPDRYGVAQYDNIPSEIEVCNLGSSHGVHSYYYEEFEDEYTCFNFALDSQGLSYDERILEEYKDSLKEGCVVIIDISYFQFWGSTDVNSDDFLSYNKRYYRILSPERIIAYDWFTDMIVKRFRCLDTAPGEVIKTILFGCKEKEEVKSYPEVSSVVDTYKLEEDTYLSSRRHIFDNKRDEQGTLIINDAEMDALDEIVKVCHENGFKPVFVTVPYLKEYKNAIREVDSAFLDSFDKMIRKKSKELHVEYWDYSDDIRFCDDYSLFYNGDHMNTTGAEKFTAIVFDEVIEDMIEKSR